MRDNVTAETDMILIWTLNGWLVFPSCRDVKEIRDDTIEEKKSPCQTHPVHVFGAGISSKHREDPRAATNIQDNLIFEDVFIVVHGVPVCQCSNLIFEHLLEKQK